MPNIRTPATEDRVASQSDSFLEHSSEPHASFLYIFTYFMEHYVSNAMCVLINMCGVLPAPPPSTGGSP